MSDQLPTAAPAPVMRTFVKERRSTFECSPVKEDEHVGMSKLPSSSLTRHQSAFLLTTDDGVPKRRSTFETDSELARQYSGGKGSCGPDNGSRTRALSGERNPSLDNNLNVFVSSHRRDSSTQGSHERRPSGAFGSSSQMMAMMALQQLNANDDDDIVGDIATDDTTGSSVASSRSIARKPSLMTMLSFSGSQSNDEFDSASAKVRQVTRKPSLTTLLSFSGSQSRDIGDVIDGSAVVALAATGAVATDNTTTSSSGSIMTTNNADSGMSMLPSAAYSAHSFFEEEKEAFANHINMYLGAGPASTAFLPAQFASTAEGASTPTSPRSNNSSNICDDATLSSSLLSAATTTATTATYVPHHLKHHLPLRPHSMDLFERTGDGLVLCHLINATVGHHVIAENSLNHIKAGATDMNIFQKTENLNKALAAAKAIGCQVVNIGAQDIVKGNPILILGIVWQIIKLQLLTTISLENFPLLVVLMQEGERLQTFSKLSAETILLRWLNYILRKAEHRRVASTLDAEAASATASSFSHRSTPKVTDFGNDLRDSEVYSTVLHYMDAGMCPLIDDAEESSLTKAEHVIAHARSIGTKVFVSAKDITDGNRRLNSSLVAQLFHTNHCLSLDTEEHKEVYVSALYFMKRNDQAQDFLREQHELKFKDNKRGNSAKHSQPPPNASATTGTDKTLRDQDTSPLSPAGKHVAAAMAAATAAAALCASEHENNMLKQQIVSYERQVTMLRKQVIDQQQQQHTPAAAGVHLVGSDPLSPSASNVPVAATAFSHGLASAAADVSSACMTGMVGATTDTYTGQDVVGNSESEVETVSLERTIDALRQQLSESEQLRLAECQTNALLSQQLVDTKVTLMERIADLEDASAQDALAAQQMISSLEAIVVRAAHWMNADGGDEDGEI